VTLSVTCTTHRTGSTQTFYQHSAAHKILMKMDEKVWIYEHQVFTLTTDLLVMEGCTSGANIVISVIPALLPLNSVSR